MPIDDRTHFEQYRTQTRLKHEIVESYLKPLFNILKRQNPNLTYLDGFAGRGTYTDPTSGNRLPGSPLRALQVIVENEGFPERVSALFVELDRENFAELETEVRGFYEAHPSIREPVTLKGEFKDVIGALLDSLDEAGTRLAPTFLLIDPCGIRGVSFEAIRRVMEAPSTEAFIFFNYDGIQRVAGLDGLSPTLVELFGSEERAQRVVTALAECQHAQQKEEVIITEYRRAFIEEIGTPYVTVFRVEYEHRRATSHFFLHATKHPLGFCIMKDVMWPKGQSEEGQGGLEFTQASNAGTALIRPSWQAMKEAIVEALATGPRKVSFFTKEWVAKPEDVYCRLAYRKALLELEAEGRIEVLDKDGVTPAPAGDRRPYRGG